MKTAISIPDDTFAAAERRAAELGVSRSEFFTTAARRYLRELDAQSLETTVNEVVDLLGEDNSSRAAVARAHALLTGSDEW